MQLTPDLSRRVLLYSSAGHALMHLMTAFYAVIVLTLAVSWKLPAEDLLKSTRPPASCWVWCRCRPVGCRTALARRR